MVCKVLLKLIFLILKELMLRKEKIDNCVSLWHILVEKLPSLFTGLLTSTFTQTISGKNFPEGSKQD